MYRGYRTALARQRKTSRKKAFKRTVQMHARRTVIPRGIRIKVHHFKQTFHPTSTSFTVSGSPNCNYYPPGTGAAAAAEGILVGPNATASALNGFFTYKFLFSDLPQATSYSSLFDAYKINRVVIKFVPVNNSYQPFAVGNQAASTEFLQTVIDYDDATLPTTLSSLLEYETFKETPAYRNHKRIFTPSISSSVFKTSGTTIGYAQKKSNTQWLDIAYTDVECYGIKGAISGGVTPASNIQAFFKVYVTVYFSCKQVR